MQQIEPSSDFFQTLTSNLLIHEYDENLSSNPVSEINLPCSSTNIIKYVGEILQFNKNALSSICFYSYQC